MNMNQGSKKSSGMPAKGRRKFLTHEQESLVPTPGETPKPRHSSENPEVVYKFPKVESENENERSSKGDPVIETDSCGKLKFQRPAQAALLAQNFLEVEKKLQAEELSRKNDLVKFYKTRWDQLGLLESLDLEKRSVFFGLIEVFQKIKNEDIEKEF